MSKEQPLSDDYLREIAAAHALGALPGPESGALEDELERVRRLDREVSAYREVTPDLALSAPRVTPPAGLRDRVMARVRRETRPMVQGPLAIPQPSRARLASGAGAQRWLALAAGLLIAAGAAFFAFKARTDAQNANRELAAARKLSDSLAGRLAFREATLDQLLLPNTSLHRLALTGERPPTMQIFWVKSRNKWLVHVTQMPPAPAGRAFQLWYVIGKERPISAQVFNTDPEGHAFFELELPAAAQRGALAAVTLEPQGGSPQPTTTPFLAGQVE